MPGSQPRAALSRPLVLALLAGTAVLLAPELPSRGGGILPFELGAPPNLTSAFPACGNCHDPVPNANGPVRVSIATSPLSLAPGGQQQAQVLVEGGPGLGLAGFCLETSAGTFTPGPTTKVSLFMPPTAIAHNSRQNNTWAFQFNAPAAPGPVQWTAVGQSVDNNNLITGDSWGFFGPSSAAPGVPFRLYVNAPSATSAGDGCPGTDGHVPILGASADAVLGQALTVDLINVPAGTVALAMAGYSLTRWGAAALPIDLTSLGAPGCFVRINGVLMQSVVTAGSGSGGGTAAIQWPLPNDPALHSQSLLFQSLVVDPGANPGSFTISNVLRVVVP